MDYKSTYRSFLNSYYLGEGLRITAGMIFPAVIGAYLNQGAVGFTMSLGALCVYLADSPGPVQHRRNAMIICSAIMFISTILTGLALYSLWTTGLLVAVYSFFFSIIAVYGVRAGAVGLATLLVMILNLRGAPGETHIYLNAFYFLCGGIWYILLSLSLYGFHPYKVTQQTLGDCMQTIAKYMSYRAEFYSPDPAYDQIYARLLDKQVEINDKQNLIRELLYKGRDIVKESTNTGRVILLIFIDMNDFFERMMSIEVDYKLIHQQFDHTEILGKFKDILVLISEELNNTGIAIKSGRAYRMQPAISASLTDLKTAFKDLKDKEKAAGNLESFIILRSVLNALEEFVSRLQTIQQYSSYDLNFSKDDARIKGYQQFVTHQSIQFNVLKGNLNWESNIFRHALRVCIAMSLGYIVSNFFPGSHGYWILLTILVILKPAYSFTKKRNTARLLGTAAGAVLGGLIVFFINDSHLLFGCMVIFMILSFSFVRTNYLVFVSFMTTYLFLLFDMINPHQMKGVVTDRLMDTAIGSVISITINAMFSPAWTYKDFASLVRKIFETNKNYFTSVSAYFTGQNMNQNQYKLSRKDAYVALANISNALNQMIAEPKSKQKNMAAFHQVVVLNYMLTSHVATLSSLAQSKNPPLPDPEYIPVVNVINANLNLVKKPGQKNESESEDSLALEGLRKINARVNALISNRKSELLQGKTDSSLQVDLISLKSVNDQFNFIWKISNDLLKIAV